MNNAEKFKQIFGLYATELWSMPEGDFLAWLNRAAETAQNVRSVDDALTLLDSIRSGGRMMYSDYCVLHDAISSISMQTVIDDMISRKVAVEAEEEEME